MSSQDEHPSEFAIAFIDPLFAVAVHLGLSHGIFAEPWFASFRTPAGLELFHVLVFGLGLLTLVLAWLGYHRSIRKRPIRAFGRFVVDILLVILYAALLVKYHDILACLLLLVAIYALYTLWDLLKILEYHGEYQDRGHGIRRYKREFVTLLWLLAFFSLYVGVRTERLADGTALAGAYVATIAHRVNKAVPMWTILGNALGRVFLHGKPNAGP